MTPKTRLATQLEMQKQVEKQVAKRRAIAASSPYGPIEPLSDPKLDKKLRALLEEQLVPVDIDVNIPTDAETWIEIFPPGNVGFYSIEGITSRHHPNEFKIKRAEINNHVVLRDVDACIYNLGHLVPYALGVISPLIPLILLVQPHEHLAVIPPLSMTLWGKTHPGTLDVGLGQSPPYPKALAYSYRTQGDPCPTHDPPPTEQLPPRHVLVETLNRVCKEVAHHEERDPERGETKLERKTRECDEWRDKYLARSEDRQGRWLDGWEACLRAGQGQQRRSLRDRMMAEVFGTAMPEE